MLVLARNAVVNLGGRLAAIVLALLVSTVLFRQLGAADYGVWSLLVVVAGYSMLFDFGLAAAVERTVAALWVGRDEPGISRVLSTALTVLVLGLAALQVLVGAWFLSRRSWQWPEGALDRGLMVLPLCMAMTASALVVGAGLAGLQRMAALQAWRVSGLALGLAAVLSAVLLGVRRMDVLLIAYCAGGIVTAILQWRALRELTPGLVLGPGLNGGAVNDLLRFGGVLQVATMVPPVAEYGFRVLIGARFGLELVGVYDLAGRAAIVLRSLAGALFSAMVPFGVQTLAERGTEGVERLIRLTVKYTALFVFPATVLAWSQADLLVSLWLGDGSAAGQVRTGFRILLAVHAVGSLEYSDGHAGPVRRPTGLGGDRDRGSVSARVGGRHRGRVVACLVRIELGRAGPRGVCALAVAGQDDGGAFPERPRPGDRRGTGHLVTGRGGAGCVPRARRRIFLAGADVHGRQCRVGRGARRGRGLAEGGGRG